MLLVLGGCSLLLLNLVAYQAPLTENMVVLRFGRPVVGRDTSPGLHFKWPFETVWRVDNRIHCTDGAAGVVEEVFTKDEKNIVVTVYVCWRVSDSVRFLQSVKTIDAAERQLTTLLRSYKNGVFGRYEFGELINIDASRVRLVNIEAEIHAAVEQEAMKLYGVEITDVGIKHIGFPESVTMKILERMKAEREAEAQQVVAEGEAISMKIRAEADKQRESLLAAADGNAKKIRATADAETADYYAVFQQNPELAEFLRKREALRKTLSQKTTLILDTDTVPFDLLRNDALRSDTDTAK